MTKVAINLNPKAPRWCSSATSAAKAQKPLPNQSGFDIAKHKTRRSLATSERQRWGQPAIQIFKYGGMTTVEPGDPTPPEPIIPNGFNYLIKQ